MEKSLMRQLKLGIFVISATILFIAGVYFIGARQNIFGNTYQIYALFNNTNGLRIGNNVRFSGINVGSVKAIKMISDTVIVVKINIQKDIIEHIKKDATCVVTSDGLVGNMIINITPGTESKCSIVQGDTIRSFSRIRTDEMLQTLSITNENTALLTGELLALTKEIRTGKGLAGAIIEDTLMKQDIKEIIYHLKNTSRLSTSTILKLNTTIASLNNEDNLIGMINDTVMVSKVKNIITNVEKSSKELDGIMAHLEITIKNANQTVINAKDGQGTINYLSNDPHLVKNIDRTIQNLDSTVFQINKAGIQLNENLEALKHTWLLRGYFKKLEKQKKE